MSSEDLLYSNTHTAIISKCIRSIKHNVLLIFHLHSYLILPASQHLKAFCNNKDYVVIFKYYLLDILPQKEQEHVEIKQIHIFPDFVYAFIVKIEQAAYLLAYSAQRMAFQVLIWQQHLLTHCAGHLQASPATLSPSSGNSTPSPSFGK